MKDSEVLILRCPPPFYPQLASRSLLSVALLGCLPSLDAAVCVMRLHGLFFGTNKNATRLLCPAVGLRFISLAVVNIRFQIIENLINRSSGAAF